MHLKSTYETKEGNSLIHSNTIVKNGTNWVAVHCKSVLKIERGP